MAKEETHILTSISNEDEKTVNPWYSNFKLMNLAVFSVGTLLLFISHLISYLPVNTPFLKFTNWSLNIYPLFKFIEFVTTEAGMATFVALGLNLSMEWVNRSKQEKQQKSLLSKLEAKHAENSAILLNRVRRQLLQTVYERNIPEEIFCQIDRHLLNKDQIRKEYKASYTISKFLDPATRQPTEFVELKGYYQYTLVNISHKALDTSVRATIDLTPNYETHCKFSSVIIGESIYSYEKLVTEKFILQDKEGRPLLNLSVPVNLTVGESLKVHLEYVKLGHLNYCEAVCVFQPTTDLRLEILIPHEDFIIEVESLHPEEPCLTSAVGRRSMMMEWTLHGILPGQGMYFFWRPKPIPPEKIPPEIKTAG